MYPIVGQCPVCGQELTVTRLSCRACDTTIEGHFSLGRLAQLSPEQVAFVETFVRCGGKITRVEKELGISYPTVRARLDDVILALGYRPSPEEPITDQERKRVLDDLAAGRISSEEAVELLRAD
jgi:hypothetical protein